MWTDGGEGERVTLATRAKAEHSMATTEQRREPRVRLLNPEETWAFFDDKARELMGTSGADFLRRLDAGEYDEIAAEPEHRDIMYLAMLGAGAR